MNSPLRVRVISESEFTVQGHGVHTAYVELTNATKVQPGVEVIVNQRGECDITHIHTVGMYALWYLLFGSGKKVISAHIVPESLVGSLIGTKYWLPLARIYLRWFYNRADIVLAVSDETKDVLVAMGVHKPIDVFYNTIDTSRYARSQDDQAKARAILKLPMNGPIVMGAGQIQPRKRLDIFVKAAEQLPDVGFVWVGGMPFKQLAASHGDMEDLMRHAPKNVLFPGLVPLDEMRFYYHAADIFMMPSDQETFGLVALEAAASGLPLVLRDLHDYDNTFRNFSVMVPGEEFVPAIQKLIDDKEYYAAMQRESARLAERYDSKKGAERLVELYRSL